MKLYNIYYHGTLACDDPVEADDEDSACETFLEEMRSCGEGGHYHDRTATRAKERGDDNE